MEISPPTDGEPPKPTPRDGFGGSAEPEPARGFHRTGRRRGARGAGAQRAVAGGGSPEGGPGDWPRRAAAAGRRVGGSAGNEPRGGGRRRPVPEERRRPRGGCRLPLRGADSQRAQAREIGPMGSGRTRAGSAPCNWLSGAAPETRRPVPRGPRDCLRFHRDRPRVHRDHGPGPAPQGRPLRLPLGPGTGFLQPAPLRPASGNPLGAGPRQPAPRAAPPSHPPSPGPAPAFRGPTAVPPP